MIGLRITLFIKKRMKRVDLHLFSSSCKKNLKAHCLDILDQERKIQALRELAQSPPSTNVIVPMGPLPAEDILSLSVVIVHVRPPL